MGFLTRCGIVAPSWEIWPCRGGGQTPGFLGVDFLPWIFHSEPGTFPRIIDPRHHGEGPRDEGPGRGYHRLSEPVNRTSRLQAIICDAAVDAIHSMAMTHYAPTPGTPEPPGKPIAAKLRNENGIDCTGGPHHGQQRWRSSPSTSPCSR